MNNNFNQNQQPMMNQNSQNQQPMMNQQFQNQQPMQPNIPIPPQQPMMNQQITPPSENNTVGALIALLLIVALIGGVGYIVYTKLNPPTAEEVLDKENKEEKNNQTAESKWNGIYKKGEHTIKIYQFDESLVMNYDMGQDILDVVKNEAESFHNILTLDGDTIIYEIDEYSPYDEDEIKEYTGTYTKEGEYTLEDLYTDTFGDVKYANSSLNGIYQNDKVKITLVQIDDEEAKIYIDSKEYMLSSYANITKGSLTNDSEWNLNYEEDWLDELEKFSATLVGDTLTVTSSCTEKDNVLNITSGTYKKEKIDMEEILKTEHGI